MAITQNCPQVAWGQQSEAYSSGGYYQVYSSPEHAHAHAQAFPWPEYYAQSHQQQQAQQQEYQYCSSQQYPSQIAWSHGECGVAALSPQLPAGLASAGLAYQWMHSARTLKEEAKRPSEIEKVQKKQRTIFTNEQTIQLEIEFNNSR
jgi:hypothetical protein